MKNKYSDTTRQMIVTCQRLETSALFVAGAAAFDEVACLIRHAAIVDRGPLDLSAAAPGGVSVDVVGEDVLALASRGIGSARCAVYRRARLTIRTESHDV